MNPRRRTDRGSKALERGALVLAGDIGGTKTILALARARSDNTVEIVREARFASPSYVGLAALLDEFMVKQESRPVAACFGVPGPVIGGACRTTNLPWLIDGPQLATQLGLSDVLLLNDFAAAALGVLTLPPGALVTLQKGEPLEHSTKAVIGAGTGLGHAVLFWDGRRYIAHATEAGHGGFAPQGELQRELLAELEQQSFPVVVERVVSGPGLVRVYDFLVRHGVPTSRRVRAAMADEDPGAVITRFASEQRDSACQQALDLFVAAYGAETGSFALRTLPYGGVYIAGGIAPRILPALQRGGFIAAFCNRQRYEDLLGRFPVYVVTEPRVGLYGAAHAALSAA